MIAGTCEWIPFILLHSNMNLNPRCSHNTFYCREDEWEKDFSESARRQHTLPPVSPYRCRRQAVLDLLFDDVWQELVGWMKELVQRHWECCTSSRAEFIYFTCVNLNCSCLPYLEVVFICDWQMMK